MISTAKSKAEGNDSMTSDHDMTVKMFDAHVCNISESRFSFVDGDVSQSFNIEGLIFEESLSTGGSNPRERRIFIKPLTNI